MGKSNKKAKSDRINALRKQYDAFLEEDKKRKQRNEYILGRLDKMRISTALVPLRHQPILDTRPIAVNYLGYQTETPNIANYDRFPINQSQIYPDMQLKNNEGACLLQEISKKYILIPKLRSPFVNNCIQNVNPNEDIKTMQEVHTRNESPNIDLKPHIDENMDWKNKYEILNLLKNEEKQEADTQHCYKDVSDSNIQSREIEQPSRLLKNKQEQIVVYDTMHNELPEKDISADKLSSDLKIENELSLKDIVLANRNLDTNKHGESNEDMIKNYYQPDSMKIDTTLQYKHPHDLNIGISEDVSSNYETQPNYNINDQSMPADFNTEQNIETYKVLNVENEYPEEVHSSINDENILAEQDHFVNSEQVVFHEHDANLTQVIHSDDLINEISYNVSGDSHITENEQSVELSLAPDFQTNKVVQMKADPKVNPEKQTDLQINPTQQIEPSVDQRNPVVEKIEPTIEQTENTIDNMVESINDFNAEQNQMFYSEPKNENIQQPDLYNLDYPQNEYLQNEGYSYYEGIPVEVLPSELNDQEETQRYDPNYEQQYSDSDQGLVTQHLEQQPQYQHTEGNQLQPELFQYDQPFESEEQIEKVLDVEDGYIAQQHGTEIVEEEHIVDYVEIGKGSIEQIGASGDTKASEDIRAAEEMTG